LKDDFNCGALVCSDGSDIEDTPSLEDLKKIKCLYKKESLVDWTMGEHLAENMILVFVQYCRCIFQTELMKI